MFQSLFSTCNQLKINQNVLFKIMEPTSIIIIIIIMVINLLHIQGGDSLLILQPVTSRANEIF